MHTPLLQSCADILTRNFGITDEQVYLLYDTESPLARELSQVFLSVVPPGAITREFMSPPQPLYRWGLINPENPHTLEQKRVITEHNLSENMRTWLNHQEVLSGIVDEENSHIEEVKNDLITLPRGSLVILIQSTNFRISTFRIRLELFHRGIHVLEFNHLAYIRESEFSTFFDSLSYRTDAYIAYQDCFGRLFAKSRETRIVSTDGSLLRFGPVEPIRWNTGDYSDVENKWGTFPIGEIFTEAIDLTSVNGEFLIAAYPREDFSVAHCDPFLLRVRSGQVERWDHFPADFARIYDWIAESEGGIVMLRELWLGLNPAITDATPLSDINFYERKIGVHFSLGKKHGIYGKKLPKTEVQRFHIDVFVSLSEVWIDDICIYENHAWISPISSYS